ncbi:MAG: hypothetical protein EZS28_000477 [Streblomastix strix]|uniref:Uncharacterized protein n=1 Tax=Streblomastix strix TaxID=222440 RepID=A0A5J4X9N7_9EUKA|nr:MAG: hypothetical protein EZS28_000477 [Streblomastix strix]
MQVFRAQVAEKEIPLPADIISLKRSNQAFYLFLRIFCRFSNDIIDVTVSCVTVEDLFALFSMMTANANFTEQDFGLQFKQNMSKRIREIISRHYNYQNMGADQKAGLKGYKLKRTKNNPSFKKYVFFGLEMSPMLVDEVAMKGEILQFKTLAHIESLRWSLNQLVDWKKQHKDQQPSSQLTLIQQPFDRLPPYSFAIFSVDESDRRYLLFDSSPFPYTNLECVSFDHLIVVYCDCKPNPLESLEKQIRSEGQEFQIITPYTEEQQNTSYRFVFRLPEQIQTSTLQPCLAELGNNELKMVWELNMQTSSNIKEQGKIQANN